MIHYNIRDTGGKLVAKVSQPVADAISSTVPGVRRVWKGTGAGDCYEITGHFKFSPVPYLTVYLWPGYTVTQDK
jgi:hypothetical protein